MIRRILLALILLPALTITKAQAQVECTGGTNTTLSPFAKENVTVSTTAVGLTASVYCPGCSTGGGGNAVAAVLQFVGANARVYFDGSTPTTTEGYVFTDGTFLTVCTNTIPKIRFIRDDAVDLTVVATYER